MNHFSTNHFSTNHFSTNHFSKISEFIYWIKYKLLTMYLKTGRSNTLYIDKESNNVFNINKIEQYIKSIFRKE